MSPEDVKALRKELSCSIGELARALEVEAKLVVQWESGALFPTKRHVERMKALELGGPGKMPRIARSKAASTTGLARLADPKLWEIVQKLAAHPAFFEQVAKLAEAEPDPQDE
ncbi:MAG: XRE family transcriptional regulator [Myxococcales bacterium]|nr:XRE family transcriptional regulator [Myxococcales bacterium]